MKIGIIDLGANSFHLVVYTVHDDMTYTVRERFSYLNAMGICLTPNGLIPDAMIKEGAAFVQTLCQKAKRWGAESIRIFGTSIFRDTPNGSLFAELIHEHTGISVDVLSPEEEGRLIFEVVKHDYKLENTSLIVDIGGGSSECIVTEKGKISFLASVPLGTARLLYTWKQAPNTVGESIRSYFCDVIAQTKEKHPHAVYGTSGFLRCLGAGLQQKEDAEERLFTGSSTLSYDTIQNVCKGLARGNLDKSFCTLPDKAQEVVYMGTMILLYIMKKLSIEEIMVLEISTREGYLRKVLGLAS